MAIHDEEAATTSETQSITSGLSFKEGNNLVLEPHCVQESSPSIQVQAETRKRFSGFFSNRFFQKFQRYIHYTQQLEQACKQEAEKSQSTVPDDDSTLLPFHPPKSEEHGMPDKAEESQINVPDDDSTLLPFHPPKSEEHGMPDKAEESQSTVPDDDSNLTPNHPQKCRKRGVPDRADKRRASSSSLSYGMAALVLSLLTFTAGVCPGAGNIMCAMAVSKGEVAIACPLTSDIYQSDRRTVFIKQGSGEDVLACKWVASRQNLSCSYKLGAELIDISSDRILARLPKDSLRNGTFRCHLKPPGEPPKTNCVICDPGDVPTTNTPKALPTTPKALPTTPKALPTTPATLDRPESGADGQDGGLVIAVVILSIIVLCLVLAMAAMVLFFLCYRRKMKQTNKARQGETEGFTSGEETV